MVVVGQGIIEKDLGNWPALAKAMTAAALVCATALVFLPKGMAAFAVLLVIATLLIPRPILKAWKQSKSVISTFTLLGLLVLFLAIFSMRLTGQDWDTVDNYSRFLLMGWCGLLAFAVAPSRVWLWCGACVGVAGAFAMAAWEMWWGSERAGAGSNPIVFANEVLALLVVVVYCRPQRHSAWSLMIVVVGLLLGTAAIVMSGSRGAMPGLGVMVLVAVFGNGGRSGAMRLGIAMLLLVVFLALLWSIPWLATHMRLENIQSDLEGYFNGRVDSAIGARLQFLSLAWHAFLDHPWTGVGIDRFGILVQQLPACSRQDLGVCGLGHAHNDLAQWSATLGVPGLIAILSIYLVPAFQFLRAIVRGPRRIPLGAAWAGLMLIVVYMLSGMTQSMFAHAMTVSQYAVLVGFLSGLALRESSSTAMDG